MKTLQTFLFKRKQRNLPSKLFVLNKYVCKFIFSILLSRYVCIMYVLYIFIYSHCFLLVKYTYLFILFLIGFCLPSVIDVVSHWNKQYLLYVCIDVN